MKIIFQTRFSFFGVSGWRSPASRDPARLFDPDRLERRLAMFARYTLPSLAAQSDADFEHLVLSSSLMPDIYKERLDGVVRHALGDRGRVIYRPKRHAGHMFRRYVRNTYGDQRHVVQVVLDDDDALSCDFVAHLRYHAQCVIDDPLHTDEATFLSFPRGLSLGLDSDGLPAWLAPRNVPFTNLGLALVSAPDYRKNPYMTAHRRIGERQSNRVIGSMRPFYLRAIHEHNDSRALVSEELGGDEAFAAAERHFPFLRPLREEARRKAA